MPKSMQVPFVIEGGSVADTRSPTQIVEQKIINVLVVQPLERLGLPMYGVGVQGLLFGSIDELVEVDFKTDAMADLSSYVSGATIVDMQIRHMDFSEAEITVYYKLPLGGIQSTTFNVAIPGQLNEESPL